uniref:Uncharacterized protein n=1 Tax=Strigamia maritima TaxID=126957 RepID=T1JMZ9_STRMM
MAGREPRPTWCETVHSSLRHLFLSQHSCSVEILTYVKLLKSNKNTYYRIKFIAAVIYYSWLEHKDNQGQQDESEAELSMSSGNGGNDVNSVISAPLLLKLSWLLTNVSTNVSFMVTIIYWSFLYSNEQGPPDHFNVQLHVVNSILVLIDILVTHIPCRLLHFYQSIIFASLYIMLNVTLWATKGMIIYKILNWNRPSKSFSTIFAVIIFLIILHTFLFLITKALDQCNCEKSKGNIPNSNELILETCTKS